MRENGLKAKHRKKFRPTTDSKHSHPVAPNLLDRQFETDAPNKVWVADITYIWTREGWLYLAVILDLYGRRVVGWALRRRMSQELALEALRRAIALRNPGPGLIHHSDRGSQYASRAYQKLLRSRGILCSMSRKGNCWDNAVAESFFRSLKTEGLDLPLTTREEANRCLFDYIEVFYNRKRLHSFLGYVSPADFERMRQVA
jgi:transposase InsO family protein